MLNEDLMNEKDLEIARLKLTIESFKKYDAERKIYISKLEDDLEEYSARYVELKKASEVGTQELIQKLQNRIDNQRATLRQLSNVVNLVKKANPELLEMFQNAEVADIQNQNVLLKQRNKTLKKEVEKQRGIIDQLIGRLNRVEKNAAQVGTQDS